MKKLGWILFFLISISVVIYALSVGPNSPASGTNDASTGTVAWVNPGNILVNDNVFATFTPGGTVDIQDQAVYFARSGNLGIGTNEARTGINWPTSKTDFTYGSSSDLWGQTLLPSDINSAATGAALVAQNAAGTVISNYLVASQFGFSIPTNATVNGIVIDWWYTETSIQSGVGSVDYCSMTVYYSLPSTLPRRIIITDLLKHMFHSTHDVLSQTRLSGKYSIRSSGAQ